MWRTFWLGDCPLGARKPALGRGRQPRSRYAAHGLGAVSCKRFVELCRRSGECKLTGTWVDGFLTAFNALNKDTFDILPWQPSEVVAEVAFNICRRPTLSAVVEAVTQVVRASTSSGYGAASERWRSARAGRRSTSTRRRIRTYSSA